MFLSKNFFIHGDDSINKVTGQLTTLLTGHSQLEAQVMGKSAEYGVCMHEINNGTIGKNNRNVLLHARNPVENCNSPQTGS